MEGNAERIFSIFSKSKKRKAEKGNEKERERKKERKSFTGDRR